MSVEVSDLWWRYGESWVLKDIDLTIGNGEFTVVVGPNGAGKTTLLYSIAGLIPRKKRGEMKGHVKINGKPDGTIRERDTGILLQTPEDNLVRNTVIDEVAFPLENLGVSRQEMKKRVTTALNMVHIAPSQWDKHPFNLSGGEKQRVAIASILALKPNILVLDEPTSQLDPAGEREIFRVLSDLKDECTIIMATHKISQVKSADKVVYLNNGKVEKVAPPKRFLQTIPLESGIPLPQSIELLRSLNLPLCWTLQDATNLLQDKLNTTNPIVENQYNTIGKQVLRVENVSYTYPEGTEALNDISFTLHEQDFLALMGPNGSGKTTLCKCLIGLLKPTGEINIEEKPVKELNVDKIASKIGYCFQNPNQQLFTANVYEEVAFALKQKQVPKQEIEQKVEEALQMVGLENVDKKKLPLSLTRGEKQRLAIASVLAMDPEIMIFDEPTTGQDVEQARKIMRLLTKLNRQGKTVIVVTHNTRLVANYAKTVMLMKNGKILKKGKKKDVLTKFDLLKQAAIEPLPITELSKNLPLSPMLTVNEMKKRIHLE